MTVGYGATLPSPPPAPATSWWDVSNWQSFLTSIGLLGAPYPTNMFDTPTQAATRSFQGSTEFGTALPMTGIVNKATYDKAVANGMPQYPTR